MNRQQRVRDLTKALGPRKLVWFGIRGADAQPLLALPLPVEVYSIVAPLAAMTTAKEITLEILTGCRVDLDHYDIDEDSAAETGEFWKHLGMSLAGPSAVVPYRPSGVLDSLCLARLGSAEYLGLARHHQAAFERKPWLETTLKRAGIPVVPRNYYLRAEGSRLLEPMELEHLVVRGEQSAGGADMRLARNKEELGVAWSTVRTQLVTVGPYLHGSVPLNINGCLFPEGAVVGYAPSLQLIGIGECITQPFGYCGNDFCQASLLDADCLDQLETATVAVGRALSRLGYLGAFGIDALWHEGQLYVCEVNPRFQGSSWLAARIASDLDLPDQFLDHVAAFLGLPPPPQLPLRVLVQEHKGYAQIICHNSLPMPVIPDSLAGLSLPLPESVELGLVPPNKVSVQPDGILFRVSTGQRVTETGYGLLEPFRTLVSELAARHS